MGSAARSTPHCNLHNHSCHVARCGNTVRTSANVVLFVLAPLSLSTFARARVMSPVGQTKRKSSQHLRAQPQRRSVLPPRASLESLAKWLSQYVLPGSVAVLSLVFMIHCPLQYARNLSTPQHVRFPAGGPRYARDRVRCHGAIYGQWLHLVFSSTVKVRRSGWQQRRAASQDAAKQTSHKSSRMRERGSKKSSVRAKLSQGSFIKIFRALRVLKTGLRVLIEHPVIPTQKRKRQEEVASGHPLSATMNVHALW